MDWSYGLLTFNSFGLSSLSAFKSLVDDLNDWFDVDSSRMGYNVIKFDFRLSLLLLLGTEEDKTKGYFRLNCYWGCLGACVDRSIDW